MILKILSVLMSLTSFTRLTTLDYSQPGSTVSDALSWCPHSPLHCVDFIIIIIMLALLHQPPSPSTPQKSQTSSYVTDIGIVLCVCVGGGGSLHHLHKFSSMIDTAWWSFLLTKILLFCSGRYWTFCEPSFSVPLQVRWLALDAGGGYTALQSWDINSSILRIQG